MRHMDGNRRIALLEEVAVTTGEITVSNDSATVSSADQGKFMVARWR